VVEHRVERGVDVTLDVVSQYVGPRIER